MEGSNPGGSKAGAADNLSDKVCGIASGKKTLPLSSDYSSLSASSLYVDKTLILRDIIDTTSPGTVYLFTRPRRFGKTMMATMLKSFLKILLPVQTLSFWIHQVCSPIERYGPAGRSIEMSRENMLSFTLISAA